MICYFCNKEIINDQHGIILDAMTDYQFVHDHCYDEKINTKPNYLENESE